MPEGAQRPAARSALHALRRLTMLLRNVPGGVLIGDSLRRPLGRCRRRIRVDDFRGDLRMDLDLGEHMQSQIFWHGSYSREIVFLLERILKPGMTVVDGGANIGEISLVAARRVGPGGRVFAFEPVPRFAGQLEDNVRLNALDWVEVHRVGLSDKPGEAIIYTADAAFSDGTQHDGLGTLFPSPGRCRAEQTVPLVALDAFMAGREGPVDLIKLDIEGGELAALQGAEQVLRTFGPALVIEIGEQTCRAAGYRGADILGFVRALGYRCFRIGRKGRLIPIGAADLTEFQNVYCSRNGAP